MKPKKAASATGMTPAQFERARCVGRRSTMSAESLDGILAQVQGVNGDGPVILSPLGRTPKRWIRSLRSPSGTVPPFEAGNSSTQECQPLKLPLPAPASAAHTSATPASAARTAAAPAAPVASGQPASPATAPLSGGAVIRGLARGRRAAFVWTTLAALVSAIFSALVPWGMGHAIDTGIEHGVGVEFALAGAVFTAIVLLVALGDSIGQLGEMALWNTGEFQGRRVVSHRAADRPRALKRSHTGGDIVTAAVDDSTHIGQLYTDIPELIGSLTAVGMISYLMLTTSVPLGLTILIGLPIILALLSLIAKPLEKRQEVMRAEQGALTTIATDAVQGLRILRGIGGEDAYARAYEEQSAKLRDASIQAALTASLLNSARIVAPMVMITIVIAQGAYLAFHGLLTPGQLLSFYGFTLYLRHPMWIATRFIEHLTSARVGARRIASLLSVEDVIHRNNPPQSASSSEEPAASLADGHSAPSDPSAIVWDKATLTADGLRLQPGKLTGIVAAHPDHSARIATAFARVEDPSPLLIDGIPASSIPIEVLRENIVISEATPHLFAGTLRQELLGSNAPVTGARGVTEAIWRYQLDFASASEEGAVTVEPHPSDPDLLRALDLAHAQDAYASLRGGLDGRLAEKGRNLSGGQRQRLALARAYATQAPVLILIEPTSALDAHTEAVIAADMPRARAGRTTLVATHSPLLLAQMDEVIVVDSQGVPCARGTYEDLRETSADLRRILGGEVSRPCVDSASTKTADQPTAVGQPTVAEPPISAEEEIR